MMMMMMMMMEEYVRSYRKYVMVTRPPCFFQVVLHNRSETCSSLETIYVTCKYIWVAQISLIADKPQDVQGPPTDRKIRTEPQQVLGIFYSTPRPDLLRGPLTPPNQHVQVLITQTRSRFVKLKTRRIRK